MFKVRKVLNNNALLTIDTQTQEEVIFIGNGVGFGQHMNQQFIPRDGDVAYRHEAKVDLIPAVTKNDPIYLEIASAIIDEAKKEFGNIDTSILLPLSDHIAFAIHRIQNNMVISNPFSHDISLLFDQEYQAALKARDIIEQRLDIRINDEEVGYITLHIHSARSDDQVSEGMLFAVLINESIQELEEAFSMNVDVHSLSYSRMLTHMKYLIARTKNGEKLSIDMDEFTKNQFPRAYEISKSIIKKTERALNKKIEPIELGYLALHIQRVFSLEKSV